MMISTMTVSILLQIVGWGLLGVAGLLAATAGVLRVWEFMRTGPKAQMMRLHGFDDVTASDDICVCQGRPAGTLRGGGRIHHQSSGLPSC